MRAQKERGRATEKACLLRGYQSVYEQNVGRSMNNKGHSDEVSDRNEEQHIGNWKKGDPCYEVEKNVDELCLCPTVLLKVELVSNKIGYLAEEVSKQSVKRVA